MCKKMTGTLWCRLNTVEFRQHCPVDPCLLKDNILGVLMTSCLACPPTYCPPVHYSPLPASGPDAFTGHGPWVLTQCCWVQTGLAHAYRMRIIHVHTHTRTNGQTGRDQHTHFDSQPPFLTRTVHVQDVTDMGDSDNRALHIPSSQPIHSGPVAAFGVTPANR